MKPIRLNNRPMILARLFCLVLMAALLANPVLAAVSTAMDCGGQCCCCADTGHGSTPTISGNTDMNSACCGPTGSIPCHLSDGRLPNAPPALIQTAKSSLDSTIFLLPGNRNAGVSPRPRHLSTSRIDTGTIIPIPPLYLQSCRLIC
ncbi:MAG: hypothetical protein KQI81_22355 [Deltaproteobacteria bacterium]|nr:hypothetical protein [Deltaproteobacteria bacterium]